MVKRERKSYSAELKERALSAYHNSDESVSKIAQRFGIGRDTFSSWVYRGRISSTSKKIATLSVYVTIFECVLEKEQSNL